MEEPIKKKVLEIVFTYEDFYVLMINLLMNFSFD